MYELRAFDNSDADYDTMVAIWNAYRPDDPNTAEQEKHWDRMRNPNLPFQRLMISADGKVIAYGGYYQNETLQQANKYGVGVTVHPEHEHQQTVRAFFLDYVLTQLSDQDINAISMGTREDHEEDVRFFSDHGFIRKMRIPRSHLDPQAFDFAPYEGLLQKMTVEGIEIITLKQLQAEHPDDWQKITYPLDMEIIADMPRTDPFVWIPFDDYCKRYVDDPMFMPEACFVARIGNDYVGASNLWRDVHGTDKLWVGLTGTLKAYRRRGIATAMKVYTIKFAKAYGAKVVEADNEENNPMYQINLRLGFYPQPGYLSFEKSLKEATSEEMIAETMKEV